MGSASVTSKNQITVPADVRAALRLVPGSKLHFTEMGDGSFRVTRSSGSIKDLRSVLADRVPTLSLEDIEEAVSAGALASADER